MPVFVAVVVLGLVFFLSCLLAIHWDEHRRRRHPADTAIRELTPLEVIPTNARTQPYRRLILLPGSPSTPSARPPLNGRVLAVPGGVLSGVRRSPTCPRERETMRDLIFVAITIAFFVLSIAYVKFCERVR